MIVRGIRPEMPKQGKTAGIWNQFASPRPEPAEIRQRRRPQPAYFRSLLKA